ncbi:MAG: hypothetical protein WCX61_04325 [Candidatus Peribacteraceae bacterium]|jgi:hypothetical protein
MESNSNSDLNIPIQRLEESCDIFQNRQPDSNVTELCNDMRLAVASLAFAFYTQVVLENEIDNSIATMVQKLISNAISLVPDTVDASIVQAMQSSLADVILPIEDD